MIDYIAKLETTLDKVYINEFLDIVGNKCKSIRKPKYSNEYYLYHIMLILTDLQKWKSLRIVCDNKSEYHYKTMQDKHLLICVSS